MEKCRFRPPARHVDVADTRPQAPAHLRRKACHAQQERVDHRPGRIKQHLRHPARRAVTPANRKSANLVPVPNVHSAVG